MTPSIFLIDMDDTLYDEREYINAGYRAVAQELSKQTDIHTDTLYARLIYEHQKYGRYQVFNRLCEFAAIHDPDYHQLVTCYREAPRQLSLYTGAQEALKLLRSIAPVIVITDGAIPMQQAKFKALKLAPLVDDVVYCWQENKPKPSPMSFLGAIKEYRATTEAALIVGDDPYHDGLASNAVGSQFCRVRTGKYSAVNLPGVIANIDLKSFAHLPEYLMNA